MTDTGRAEASTNLFIDALDPHSAANLIRWTAGLQARIKVRMVNEAGERGGEETAFVCDPPSPGSFLRLAALGVRPGERVEVTAEGPDAQDAIRRVDKALGEEPPPTVDAELERALRFWVASLADPNPSEERRAKIRELVDDHIQHAIHQDRLWTGEKDEREGAKRRWVYSNKTDAGQRIEVYKVHPRWGYETEEYTIEAGESCQFDAAPNVYMSVWSPDEAGAFRKRQEKKVSSLCERLPRFLSRELDIPYGELMERWFA